MESGKTIDYKYYLDICLKPLVESIKLDRKTSGTKNHINSEGFKIIDHPDLAPSDFWLFDEIKRRLPNEIPQGSMKDVITRIVFSISKKEYQKTFLSILEDKKLCIEANGEYFEHLMK